MGIYNAVPKGVRKQYHHHHHLLSIVLSLSISASSLSITNSIYREVYRGLHQNWSQGIKFISHLNPIFAGERIMTNDEVLHYSFDVHLVPMYLLELLQLFRLLLSVFFLYFFLYHQHLRTNEHKTGLWCQWYSVYLLQYSTNTGNPYFLTNDTIS